MVINAKWQLLRFLETFMSAYDLHVQTRAVYIKHTPQVSNAFTINTSIISYKYQWSISDHGYSIITVRQQTDLENTERFMLMYKTKLLNYRHLCVLQISPGGILYLN